MNSQASSPTHLFDLPGLCRYFSERSPQPLVAVEGPTHVIRYLNSAFVKLSRKSADDLLGRSLAGVLSAKDDDEFVALLDGVYRTGRPANLAEHEQSATPPTYWSYEMWAIVDADERPAGVMIQVTDSTEAAVFRREARAMNEALVFSSVRQHELIDTIEQNEKTRRAMEAQMFQAQKLESLGVLAGGIAHDLNNVLTPVLGFAELAATCIPAGSLAVPMLEEVRKNARRAADLVQQILAYAGKGRFVLRLVDLSSLVREMSGLLGSAVAEHAKLEFDLSSDLPAVEGDATQLYQVVLNLVTNASEAIPEGGGKVTVRTGRVPVDPSARKPPREPSVFLEVVDTGSGMTPDVIDKIFDPFFSTKFTGRGLGLAVVQGIARGHGGVLQVHSVPGAGSTFRLILPSSTKTVATPAVRQSADGWQGIGTILVIDDDDKVRDIVSHLLKRAGLIVFGAADGVIGLESFREHGGKIDAVVLDLTMPRMGGLDVAKALRKLQPDVPIVLMSGFSVVEVTHLSEGLGIAAFLQKPFRNADLLAAIRHALGQ